MVEYNLDAVCKSPKEHRDQLLQHVHRPEMQALRYANVNSQQSTSKCLDKLKGLYCSLDIEKDPAVMRLKALGVDRNHVAMRKALHKKSTFCQKTTKAIVTTAQSIFDELGSWACDYYICCCVSKIQRLNIGNFLYEGLDHNETRYLQNLFATTEWLTPSADFIADDTRLSPKTHCLLKVLNDELKGNTAFAGLIFTQTRASVPVLAHVLASQANFAISLKIGTFVGSSSHTLRKSLAEVNDVESKMETLNDLRVGKKNLIIATSVLEEGIDIAACNIVICFEPPQNLKSFIQRRGRARQSQSKYIGLFKSDSSQAMLERQWRASEEEMVKKYTDEMREHEEWKRIEEADNGEREYTIPETG